MVLEALSDPTRRAILESLRNEPCNVTSLAQRQPVSRPAVSQHLKVLEQAGLVSVKTVGRNRIYAIRQEGLQELRQYLDQFWDDTLNAFQREIHRRIAKN